MKLHRFFIAYTTFTGTLEVSDMRLTHQWGRVLRFVAGTEIVLFNKECEEALYRIETLSPKMAHLRLLGFRDASTPLGNVGLYWSLLKKEKNDWVIQKATELGVSRFAPIIAERTEKTGFNLERARLIAIEAAEQCGRTDIPEILDPQKLSDVLFQASTFPRFACDAVGSNPLQISKGKDVDIFVGPEGGWTEAERARFAEEKISFITLSPFTLRAETACIAVALLAEFAYGNKK